MDFRIGAASISIQSAMNAAKAQVSHLNFQGLNNNEKNAMTITNLMNRDEEKGLIGKLMGGSKKKSGIGIQSQQDTYQFNKDMLSGIISTKI